MELRLRMKRGAPVAQWVKRWPADLEVPCTNPAEARVFPVVNLVPLHSRLLQSSNLGYDAGLQGKLISGLYFSFGLNL